MASTPSTSCEDQGSNDESLELLVSMGFDLDLASAALAVARGNLENAINYLTDETARSVVEASVTSCSQNCASFAEPSSHSSSSDVGSSLIVASTSQYSFDGGQSACTCIALEIAEKLVLSVDPLSELSPTFLDTALRRGIEIYESILTSSVNHMSAEDAWTHFSYLKLQGEIIQGVLSRDPSHPQGLTEILRRIYCPTSSASATEYGKDWVFVVLTKTPESILLCLSRHGYVLIDSHPRPHIWPDAFHAYAKRHKALEELVSSVQLVFPIVDLGPGVPDLMSIMYNSFDLYVFTKNPT
jgi:hypothetical protein